jgi:hypothetical protein
MARLSCDESDVFDPCGRYWEEHRFQIRILSPGIHVKVNPLFSATLQTSSNFALQFVKRNVPRSEIHIPAST